jgi:putative PIN family toxin of toxin-antitoxin system
MRVVLDTSVVVAGLRSSRGASSVLLHLLVDRKFVGAASPALFLEYEDVLRRTEHRLPTALVESFLTELAAVIEPVQIRFLWRPMLLDPDDEMVLEAAINGHAEAIVTHNRRDFAAASVRFGIAVLSPGEFLTQLRQEGAKEP